MTSAMKESESNFIKRDAVDQSGQKSRDEGNEPCQQLKVKHVAVPGLN